MVHSSIMNHSIPEIEYLQLCMLQFDLLFYLSVALSINEIFIIIESYFTIGRSFRNWHWRAYCSYCTVQYVEKSFVALNKNKVWFRVLKVHKIM